jgi:ethanolamine utilization protein EutQ (cupin superfamily)
MLEGEITLSENGETRAFRPGDVVYIPQKQGLLVYWSTDSYGKFFYVTYPHWR